VTIGTRASLLRYSPLESARFGLRVFRGSVDEPDIDEIASEFERERIDVAIARVPAHALAALGSLARAGWTTIVADTLVSYEIALPRARSSVPEPPALRLRRASRDERQQLEDVVRSVFSGYVSHYHANPLFAPEKILDGYVEWAVAHLDCSEGRAVWLVEDAGETVGFSCYCIDMERRVATGVLNGVTPATRRRGVYRGMLQAMLDEFENAGMQRFVIATQVHNVTVQRAWIAAGLSLRSARCTVHINANRLRVAEWP
jgi:hypothetical protein